MKLSKTLLSAILLGIAVQTVSSCAKQDKDDSPKPYTDNQGKQQPQNNPIPDNCPACGLG
jgi:hypothetical protein